MKKNVLLLLAVLIHGISSQMAYSQNAATTMPPVEDGSDLDVTVDTSVLPPVLFEVGPDGKIIEGQDGAPKKATTYIEDCTGTPQCPLAETR